MQSLDTGPVRDKAIVGRGSPQRAVAVTVGIGRTLRPNAMPLGCVGQTGPYLNRHQIVPLREDVILSHSVSQLLKDVTDCNPGPETRLPRLGGSALTQPAGRSPTTLHADRGGTWLPRRSPSPPEGCRRPNPNVLCCQRCWTVADSGVDRVKSIGGYSCDPGFYVRASPMAGHRQGRQ